MPALLLPLLLGCGGDRALVSGTITYEGKNVEDGFVTFFPADGRGTAAGAEIHAGRYSVANLRPGKKRVYVTSLPRAAPTGSASDRKVRLLPPKCRIPKSAAGNNEVVEVRAGSQTLDFRLRKPASRR